MKKQNAALKSLYRVRPPPLIKSPPGRFQTTRAATLFRPMTVPRSKVEIRWQDLPSKSRVKANQYDKLRRTELGA